MYWTEDEIPDNVGVSTIFDIPWHLTFAAGTLACHTLPTQFQSETYLAAIYNRLPLPELVAKERYVT